MFGVASAVRHGFSGLSTSYTGTRPKGVEHHAYTSWVTPLITFSILAN